MFDNLSIWKWHMDFVGQKHAEYLFRTIVIMCGIVGFILGYVKQQFSITIGLTLIGVFVSALLTLPPWPIYARNPLKWRKVKKVKKIKKIKKNITYDEHKEDKNKEKKMTKSGTSEEYRTNLQKLQNNRKSRFDVPTELRNFKLTNAKNKYESEEQALRKNFKNNKDILYDTIKADVEEKIEQLEGERNKVDIDTALWLGRSFVFSSGRGRGRLPYSHVQPKREPVIVSGPCIVYNLKEHEILEDWITIKKSLLSSKLKENAEHQYKPYN